MYYIECKFDLSCIPQQREVIEMMLKQNKNNNKIV